MVYSTVSGMIFRQAGLRVCETRSQFVSRSAKSPTEAISLALHSVSYALERSV